MGFSMRDGLTKPEPSGTRGLIKNRTIGGDFDSKPGSTSISTADPIEPQKLWKPYSL